MTTGGREMSESEFNSGNASFPPELVQRCRNAAFGRNWTDAVLAVLRESGHAEMVAALKDARPYVWSPSRFKDDKRANETLTDIDAALRKAGAL